MKEMNMFNQEKNILDETVSSWEEILKLAERDFKLKHVINHINKRDVEDPLEEIKRILYIDEEKIKVGAIEALPYLYYNYVIHMDYCRGTMEFFPDIIVKKIEGDSEENILLTIEKEDGCISEYSLKEFIVIAEPACKYETTVNNYAELRMPASLTTEAVFKAIKECLL